jgi:hypothetical protein
MRHGKGIVRGLALVRKMEKSNEAPTVTIARRKTRTTAKAAKKPNATFGM